MCADKANAIIRSEFEKTSIEIEEERENFKSSTSSSFFQKLKKKFSFSSDSSKTCRHLDHNFTIKKRIQDLILT